MLLLYFHQILCSVLIVCIVFTLGQVQSFPTFDSPIANPKPGLKEKVPPVEIKERAVDKIQTINLNRRLLQMLAAFSMLG